MMRISERAALGIVVGGFLLLQIPFLPVPFRVDEPNILAIAEQIAADPLDPYGFEINWLGTPQPAWEVLRNPPLVPYWIAGWAALFGWSEAPVHAAMLPWGVVALLAVGRLAKRAGMAAWIGAALLGSSVIFFVSAPLAMPDVAALALAAGALALALRDDRISLASAALLAAAAPLAKYTALAVAVPLVIVAWRRDRRGWRWAVAAAPVASLLLWSRISAAIYGESHLTASAAAQGGLKAVLLPAVVDLGLAVFPIGLAAVAILERRIAALAAAAALVTFPVLFLLTENRLDSALLASAGTGLAVAVVAAGVRRTVEEPHPVRIAALAWICAVVGLAFGYQFVTSRYLLAAGAAGVVLIGGSRIPRWFPAALGAGALLSVAVAATDAMQASIYPRIARTVVASPGERVWLAGHWGFQYYGMAAGGRMLDLEDLDRVKPGDRIVLSEGTFPGIAPSRLVRRLGATDLETVVVRTRWPLRTQACGPTISLHGAGASSCENAYRVAIPWGTAREPLETVHRFRAGERASAPEPGAAPSPPRR